MHVVPLLRNGLFSTNEDENSTMPDPMHGLGEELDRLYEGTVLPGPVVGSFVEDVHQAPTEGADVYPAPTEGVSSTNAM